MSWWAYTKGIFRPLSLHRLDEFGGGIERSESSFQRAAIMRATFLRETGRHSLPRLVRESERSVAAVIEFFENGGRRESKSKKVRVNARWQSTAIELLRCLTFQAKRHVR